MNFFRYAIILLAFLFLTACPSEDPPVQGEIDNIPGSPSNNGGESGDDAGESGDDAGEAGDDASDENDPQDPPINTIVDCSSNSDCDDDQYCQTEENTCRKGICVDRPNEEDCFEEEMEYCDCNGETQTSSTNCILEPFLHFGACDDVVAPTPGGDQSRVCKYNNDCDEGEYCDGPPGCETPGECKPLPSEEYIQENCEQTPTVYCDCFAGQELTSPTTCIFDSYKNTGSCP